MTRPSRAGQTDSTGMLIGRKAIAEYCGTWPSTIDNWKRRHGFPFCHMPDGRVATSANLIDKWILERRELQKEAQARVKTRAQKRDLSDRLIPAPSADP